MSEGGAASEKGAIPTLIPISRSGKETSSSQGACIQERRTTETKRWRWMPPVRLDLPRSPPSVSASASGHGHGHGYSRSWHGHGAGMGPMGLSPLGGFSLLGRSPVMAGSPAHGHAQNIPIASRRDREAMGISHSLSSGAHSDRLHHGRTDSEGSSGSGSYASHSLSGHGHGRTPSLGHSYSSSHTYSTSTSSPGGATRHKHSRSFSGSGFSGPGSASGHSRNGSYHGHHPYARPPMPQGMGDPAGKDKDLPPLPPLPRVSSLPTPKSANTPVEAEVTQIGTLYQCRNIRSRRRRLLQATKTPEALDRLLASRPSRRGRGAAQRQRRICTSMPSL